MPSSDPDLAGFRIYHCTQQPRTRASANDSLLVTLGKGDEFPVWERQPVTHYYYITAYDLANHESGASNLVTFTPNAPPLPPHLVLSWGSHVDVECLQ